MKKIKIKTKNLCAQFMEVGQVIDFKIEKNVVGKCKIINIDRKSNEIELELDDTSSKNMGQFADFMNQSPSFLIE